MFDATPFLRQFASRRKSALARQDAVAEQERQLLKLLRGAGETRFGLDHDFGGVKTVADFQARVPLRNYEAMWTEYWRSAFPRLVDCTWPGTVPYFALSSGTTSGTTKYIPCTEAMNRSNGRAALDLLAHHLTNRPESRAAGGKTFMLGGSTDLTELTPGVWAGDLSGIAASRVPYWARSRVFPPARLALIADWEKKVDILSRQILDLDIRSIAGTPSWLLVFFERLFALRPDREPKLHAFFPNLELITHGGVNFAPYRRRFTALMQGTHAETREAYAASEGFVASADRGSGEGMRLMADNGIFFEFVPVAELGSANPTRHWLATAETEVDYALTVSSCAGLWAYLLGDVVRFVDLKPPRLLVTGRTSYTLSAFGEHLTGGEIEDSVAGAAAAIGIEITEFAMGAILPDGTRSRGSHLLIAAFATAPPTEAEVARFLDLLDHALSQKNDDYQAHRSGGFGLDPPRMLVVGRGMFEAWMKSRGQLGGQHKVPRVIADPALFEALYRFALTYPEPASEA